MAKAEARHILVDSDDLCKEIIEKISNGEDFSQLAKQYSKCPSGQQGGNLGEFSPGQMVPEFDKVVFSEKIGEPHGPVKTDFGFHVIEIIKRS